MPSDFIPAAEQTNAIHALGDWILENAIKTLGAWQKDFSFKGILSVNISSLQLIPVNMIAYRSQYGSVNPAVIVGPAIVATALSTGVAVVFCKCMEYNKSRSE